MRKMFASIVAAAACTAVAMPVRAQNASLELAVLGTGLTQQQVTGISADGSTVIGVYRRGSGQVVGFEYRPGRGGLWILPPGTPAPVPGGVSADGVRIGVAPVGQIGLPRTAGVLDRARGDVAFTVPGMGTAGQSDSVTVRGLSGDGRTLVGGLVRLTPVLGGQTFSRTTWIFAAGQQERRTVSWLVRGRLGFMVAYDQSSPVAASADASRVLVAVEPPLPVLGAPARPDVDFGVWSAAGGLLPIRGGTATCISGDGWTVGGLAPRVGMPGRNTATIWHADRPMARLALPPRGVGSQLFGLSHDGEVGVGAYTTDVPGEVRAMVWIRPRGTRDLTELLTSLGARVPAGVKLRTAVRVSGDGTRIAGLAAGPSGQVLVYRATLPRALVCYANCDGSLGASPLNAADTACFTQRLSAGHFYADCNRDGATNAADMACFLQRFNAGCGR